MMEALPPDSRHGAPPRPISHNLSGGRPGSSTPPHHTCCNEGGSEGEGPANMDVPFTSWFQGNVKLLNFKRKHCDIYSRITQLSVALTKIMMQFRVKT